MWVGIRSWPDFGQAAQKLNSKQLKYKELVFGMAAFWAKCPKIPVRAPDDAR
jgi:hypothetical protein